MTDFTRLDYCLACGLPNLVPYFFGGNFPSANAFYKDGEPEPAPYPLGLQYCPICYHSQNLVAVDPVVLYSNYAYASGTSQTLRDFFAEFVTNVEIHRGILWREGDKAPPKPLRVLDIACNDGSLLKEFQRRGHKVQGVDPASNLNDGTVPILNTFWGQQAIRMLPTNGGVEPYDVIVMMNVLGHVSDPLEFLTAAKHVLAPGGIIEVMTSQADMVKQGQIDTCYHEHLSFFTVSSFLALAKRAGLMVACIQHEPVHGTSYRIGLMHPGEGGYERVSDSEIGRDEQYAGYYNPALYNAFSPRVAQHAAHVKRTLDLMQREGYALAGYGASAKAVTFNNFAGIDLALIVDDSPLKQGRKCPGTGTPVVKHVPTEGKICWVLGTWTMKEEIIAKIKKARPNADDKFVTYYPDIQVTS